MAYVLFPGGVFSKSDGDHHYISAPELASLYGVDLSACRVVHRDREGLARDYIKQPEDIELYPRYDGNYQLPEEV